MRSAVAIRNVVLRKHAGVRLNQNEHLKRQLPMSMFSHIRGLTEFGLFWAVKAATHLSKHFSIYIVDLEQLHNDFDVIIDNYKVGLFYKATNSKFDNITCRKNEFLEEK